MGVVFVFGGRWGERPPCRRRFSSSCSRLRPSSGRHRPWCADPVLGCAFYVWRRCRPCSPYFFPCCTFCFTHGYRRFYLLSELLGRLRLVACDGNKIKGECHRWVFLALAPPPRGTLPFHILPRSTSGRSSCVAYTSPIFLTLACMFSFHPCSRGPSACTGLTVNMGTGSWYVCTRLVRALLRPRRVLL